MKWVKPTVHVFSQPKNNFDYENILNMPVHKKLGLYKSQKQTFADVL